jgi:hypothetical protein
MIKSSKPSVSWELGTRSLALLSLEGGPYSYFNATLPPPPTLFPEYTVSLGPVFAIARSAVSQSLASNITSAGPLYPADGAAGDPASVGTAVILDYWINQTQQQGENSYDAAGYQLAFLESDQVPKTSDGAWSHRLNQLQLW